MSWTHAIDVINALDVFCICYTVNSVMQLALNPRNKTELSKKHNKI